MVVMCQPVDGNPQTGGLINGDMRVKCVVKLYCRLILTFTPCFLMLFMVNESTIQEFVLSWDVCNSCR